MYLFPTSVVEGYIHNPGKLDTIFSGTLATSLIVGEVV